MRHRWKVLDMSALPEHYEDGGEKLHEPHTEANSLTRPERYGDPPDAIVVVAAGPTTSVQGEYLMTLYVPIAEAHDVDDTLRSAKWRSRCHDGRRYQPQVCCNQRIRKWPLSMVFVCSDQVITVRCGNFFGLVGTSRVRAARPPNHGLRSLRSAAIFHPEFDDSHPGSASCATCMFCSND